MTNVAQYEIDWDLASNDLCEVMVQTNTFTQKHNFFRYPLKRILLAHQKSRKSREFVEESGRQVQRETRWGWHGADALHAAGHCRTRPSRAEVKVADITHEPAGGEHSSLRNLRCSFVPRHRRFHPGDLLSLDVLTSHLRRVYIKRLLTCLYIRSIGCVLLQPRVLIHVLTFVINADCCATE